jgi:hypothetical protein
MAGLISSIFGDLGEKTVPAALALVGVLLGIWMYAAGWPVVVGVLGLGLASVACLAAGRALIWSRPRPARWLIEAWVVAPLTIAACLSSLAVFALLRLDISAALKTQMGLHAIDPKKIDGVADLIKGAVSGFFAIVLTKDIWEGQGPFAVATQFKAATHDVSAKLNPTLAQRASLPPNEQTRLERLIDALSNDSGPYDKITDWGFHARGRRAEVIATCKPA